MWKTLLQWWIGWAIGCAIVEVFWSHHYDHLWSEMFWTAFALGFVAYKMRNYEIVK